MTDGTGTFRVPPTFTPVVHSSYATSWSAAGHVATCTCGWSSPSTLSPGMAGALWDEHVARPAA